ncbi:MAG: hypothetical protein A3I44_02275 [Candidatus Sungbacteria bacterium RIFCSPLOWO2_02_FULL_51_17]|uniref:Uncharacterized protein n=1 Tax=Candidatus Sungbacteria bacterium RIFCSPHIGHO2_02_FULL_51_29 TaxID=1802273 RepID=A0A1G2KXC4_9BACT|nr:MAG: hypothetical protein A2676_01950 [Candidatus Sungbacteria bacterium RIFCSPHIGHO2_01_FULL_51_22]OHA04106.1 MAG: hypothetical protein A3C16_02150 [Candidatus Sungbacteria bacterium RIFCSPHIGHO2_02_FULL_51_29]OHA04758.1 MAG: hypothetical protein A3B29_01470 [Candidatus Sungbacteria bacterium RIFCSPLOWO2_01_FULL_51_34]OHA12020.1 MAG: hypothetical protein A3I44_02275 [Candidatus Sungbacteria bacterium RIFCSPLOWO2_02_FULL_51_17]
MAGRNEHTHELLEEAKKIAWLGIGAARELASQGKTKVEEFFDPEHRLEKAVSGQFADMMKDGRLKPEEAHGVIMSRVAKVLEQCVADTKDVERAGE